MAKRPDRATITLTDYGRKLVIEAKRGEKPKISHNGRRITIKFPEGATHKPKR